MIDRRPISGHRSIVADLGQSHTWRRWRPWCGFKLPRWTHAFREGDVLLHLAADRSPQAAWQQVRQHNIEAAWNVLEVAARCRVRRVVFASSTWAVKASEEALAPACYTPEGPKIDSDEPPHPLTPYGISKAFGELTGRMLVEEQRLSTFIAVRIGWYCPVPLSPQQGEARNLWIGRHDLRSLLRRCIEADVEGFRVVYGVSGQLTSPYDLAHTRQLLSWEPQQTLE